MDGILKLEKSLSLSDCKRIIDFFEKNPKRQKKGKVGNDMAGGERGEPLSTGRVDTIVKKSFDISMSFVRDDYAICTSIFKILKSGMIEYMYRYPFLRNIERWEILPSFNIQKYNPSDAYYGLHCENDGVGDTSLARMGVWMIYLNDVTDEGGTDFPAQKKKFQPCAGDLLIWPAFWTHPHRGIPSPTQTKYIATGWFTFYDAHHQLEQDMFSKRPLFYSTHRKTINKHK
jgi:hypothetical protein